MCEKLLKYKAYNKAYNSNSELCTKLFLQRIHVGLVVVGEGGSQTVKGGKEPKQKKQPSTQCKVCGTINILKYVNNF